MGSKLFRDRLNKLIQECLSSAQDCIQIEHNGLAGDVRQILVEKLLIPLLPEGIHIGRGKVTDSMGNLSSETDIIIYDRRTIPPVLYDEKVGIFPIEIVYYVIEVKTTLTKQEVDKSIRNGQKLRTLKGPQPHSALFAFSSDLKNAKDSERFIQPQKDMYVPLPINIFCVASREYGFRGDSAWNLRSQEDNDDVIAWFLVGIMNTVVEALHSRRPSIQPGWYFTPGYNPPQYDRKEI
jgi:hypothetical protein